MIMVMIGVSLIISMVIFSMGRAAITIMLVTTHMLAFCLGRPPVHSVVTHNQKVGDPNHKCGDPDINLGQPHCDCNDRAHDDWLPESCIW